MEKQPSPPSKQLLEDIKAKGNLGFNIDELSNLHEYLLMVMQDRNEIPGEPVDGHRVYETEEDYRDNDDPGEE